MTNICNVHCKFLEDIDLFGKEPELYYKGNPKRTSVIGRIFTFIYSSIYIAFFLYKFIRMIQKKDVDFYQTTTFTGKTPSIHLTNEVFYGGFGLANPLTLETFVDDSIYVADAKYVYQHKNGNIWITDKYETVDLEICQKEKFGKKYRDAFSTKNLDGLYCFKDMDYMLDGHPTYDAYSFFEIKFYPCVNSTENNFKCKSQEVIRNALSTAMVVVKIQDIELTPEDYNNPTQIRVKELTAPAFLNLYENIQAYFHIVHVETDLDFIGFDLFKNIQTKTYFKYDNTFIIPVISNEDAVLNYGLQYCQINIQLTEQILTLKRTNTKLTEVLGEVGGLMEVIFSMFRILLSFLTDNLYEQSLVNQLFSFDLDRKTIKVKDKKKKKNDQINYEENPVKIYNPNSPPKSLGQFSQKKQKDNDDINTKNILNDEDINKITSNKFVLIL